MKWSELAWAEEVRAMLSWGDSTFGQCGDGQSIVTSSQDVRLANTKHCVVRGCEDVLDVACGWNHTLVLASNGDIRVFENTQHADSTRQVGHGDRIVTCKAKFLIELWLSLSLSFSLSLSLSLSLFSPSFSLSLSLPLPALCLSVCVLGDVATPL